MGNISSTMLPKSDPKINQKPSSKIHDKYEKYIEKRSVKTSKTMLPCRRGALLAKSASFKKIPEDFQIKHEVYAKINPKTLEKTIKPLSQK